MTAPGDYVILIVLLVTFVACAGYAAGRLHQRFRNRPDRAEAYRDGYASGTRSVFSMAVRAAGPALVPPDPEPSGLEPTVPVPPASEPTVRVPPASEPTAPVPSGSGAAVPEPTVRVPPAGEPSASPPGQTPAQRPARAFPVPPPHTGPGMPEPAAAGGVTYSTLPDPRWSAAAGPVPGQREPEARKGRHTVPEELVRAATYRLPPDRVARAKVVPATDEDG